MPKKLRQQLALTVKYNPNILSNRYLNDLYDWYFGFLKTLNCKIIFHVRECDSKGKLHVHAHITAPHHLRYNALKMVYLHVFVKPMSNKTGWYRYMIKDSDAIINPPMSTCFQLYKDGIDSLDLFLDEYHRTPQIHEEIDPDKPCLPNDMGTEGERSLA